MIVEGKRIVFWKGVRFPSAPLIMKENVVAIVGRPNVGKSTLFNYIADSKISIVSDKPGVTRDRIYADCNWLNFNFKLIDTGGIELKTTDKMFEHMRQQVDLAIDLADVVIFVVNCKDGLTDLDKDVATILRKTHKPIVVCINKVDDFKKQESETFEFYELGFEDVYPVSSANKTGVGDMLDKVVSYFKNDSLNENDLITTKVAIIGKPNAGKSSLVNKLLGEERVIVSDIAGTTRDAIDTEVIKNDNKYIFIDTAGLRKKSIIKDEVEIYSYMRSEIAIDRCDIVIVMIDGAEGITKGDAAIAGLAHEKGKGVIIAVNKWDIVDKDDKTIYEFTRKIKEEFAYMPYAEIIFISAKTGKRVDELYNKIDLIRQNQLMRIQTGVLNEVLINAISLHDTPQDKGRRLKIYYVTQTDVCPPTFVLFVNDQELMHFSYLRYLENKFRESFSFAGTSIKFIVRERKDNGD